MSTGKWINDLGDFELCQSTDGLRYGALGIRVRPIGKIYLGMCLPIDCQASELQPLVDAVVSSNPKQFIRGDFVFADEASIPMSPMRVIGFIVFSILAIIYTLGFLTEYTPLFNKPGVVERSEDSAKDKQILGKFFISFSPSRNMRKLFYSPFNSEDPLKVLNGVRVLSMLYVILGHAYYNVLLVPTANIEYINTLVQPLWWQPIPGGFFAVDVFFYLSAFLGAYIMLQKFERTKKVNFIMIYFHRFYRLAPNVFLLILFAVTFYAYLGNGPIWHDQREKWTKDCPKTFWSYVLFINALWPGENNACVGWLWYLSHDFLFFVTLPVQVWVYYRSRIASYSLATLLLLLNFGIVIWITINHQIGTSMLVSPEGAKVLYYKPWARLGSYQVGIFMGYFYYEFIKGEKPDGDKNTLGYKFYKTVQISSVLRWIYYTLGLTFILWAVFIVTPDNRTFLKREKYWGVGFSVFYNVVCRPLYVFGLHLILMGPIVGKGAFLQFFLGSRFWAPWAKIAFYCYLVHLFVFTWFFGQMRQSFFLNHKAIIWSYFGVIFLSLFVATFLSVLFEAPWMQLEKLVLFPPRKKKQEKVEEVEYNSGLQEKAFDNEFSETIETDTHMNGSDLNKRNKNSF
mmetsp:Transcript_6946/g.7767  ORF Transcript_6946/g.7767 Transcript_6946/m.7767 type:complete len:626 (+) Transcript_6946:136-2013(+)